MVSIALIYNPGEFGVIWSTGRGGLKPRVSKTTMIVWNSIILEGLALHWTKVFMSSFFSCNYWTLEDSIFSSECLVKAIIINIDYYCSSYHPILDIIVVFFQVCRSLVIGSIYYLNKGHIWCYWLYIGVTCCILYFFMVYASYLSLHCYNLHNIKPNAQLYE